MQISIDDIKTKCAPLLDRDRDTDFGLTIISESEVKIALEPLVDKYTKTEQIDRSVVEKEVLKQATIYLEALGFLGNNTLEGREGIYFANPY